MLCVPRLVWLCKENWIFHFEELQLDLGLEARRTKADVQGALEQDNANVDWDVAEYVKVLRN